jgi:hypothetical protein
MSGCASIATWLLGTVKIFAPILLAVLISNVKSLESLAHFRSEPLHVREKQFLNLYNQRMHRDGIVADG